MEEEIAVHLRGIIIFVCSFQIFAERVKGSAPFIFYFDI
jgi:hypothetical protein